MTHSNPTPLALRLKQETRQQHAAVEELVDVMRPDLSIHRYTRLLQRFYGLYRPLEALLLQAPGILDVCPDYHQRRKVGLLHSDLQALGFKQQDIFALPLCQRLPACTRPPAALGVLYVLEGATLGGAIVSRHVSEILALGPDNGCAFFSSYGDQRGVMWRRFGEYLNSVDHPVFAEDVVFAARQTFTAFEQWLKDRAET